MICLSDGPVSRELFVRDLGLAPGEADIIIKELEKIGLVYLTDAEVNLSEIGEFLIEDL